MSVSNINGVEVEKIMEKLKSKGADIERAAKVALREGVKEVVDTAKSLAPVKTGKLKESVHEIEENDGASYKIVADAENEYKEQYAKIVEYSPRINRPFLYPAVEAQRNNLNEKIKDAVKREIK